MAETSSLRASIALAAYVEPLVEGRRAIVFGDASSGLADHLLARGARLIHVYDQDPARVAEAAARNTSRNVTFAPLSEGGLAIRDGAFDLAIVENLANSGAPDQLLRRLKRTLSPRGAAVIASPNPDVKVRLLPDSEPSIRLDYYALYDLIADEFEHVWMLGQTPFVGYAIAAFAPESEPVPAFDAGFVPSGAEEPEWFVALASQHVLRVEEFSVIQLPFQWALRTGSDAGRPRRSRTATPTKQQQPDPRLLGELNSLRQQLKERDAWITQLEARATVADARADEVQEQLEDLTSRNRDGKAQAENQALRDAWEALKEERDSLQAQLEKESQRPERLQQEARAQATQLAELSGIEQQAGRDLSALEEQLRAQGQQVQRLQRELREAARVGQELVSELQDREAPDASIAELRAKLDALATLNAQREGDLAAARFHVQELEAELGDVPGSADDVASVKQKLEQAQARIQEQAALLQQLGSGIGPEGTKTA